MSDELYACPHCNAYLLDHKSLIGWKKCLGCGFCIKTNKRLIYVVSDLGDPEDKKDE